jgi:ubiquinone/menaquinone biosynthesis C-methylase UbiE
MTIRRSTETDADRILAAYERRAESSDPSKYTLTRPGNSFALAQRERILNRALSRRGIETLKGLDILEVGCGVGSELSRLVSNGAEPRRISGIDLREDAIAAARLLVPEGFLVAGDATALPFSSGSFDLVYQATAFSSMLSSVMRAQVAAEMRRVVRPGGLIVSYDFAWNPMNRATVGISTRELRRLFAGMPIEVHPVTLAPPLARWLGDRSERALRIVSRVRPILSHRLAVIDVPR